MQLFYCPDAGKGNDELPAEEALHCTKVLRKTAGDQIDLTDGSGQLYKARLVLVTPKKCTYSIEEKHTIPKPDYSIHIAISPTKSPDRMEWFVEKAVEIGINRISFFKAEHSERSHLNHDRLVKKAVSAMKQSVRAYLPVIDEMDSFEKFIKIPDSEYRFIAHPENDQTRQLTEVAKKNGSFTVLIGPEGGFSVKELQLSRKMGFIPVRLGNHRLRTETAGVVACTILSMINQS